MFEFNEVFDDFGSQDQSADRRNESDTARDRSSLIETRILSDIPSGFQIIKLALMTYGLFG